MSGLAVTKHRLQFGLLVSIVSALVMVAAPQVRGACGPPESLRVALSQAESAFVGMVDTVSDQDRTAAMTVLEVWKGRDLPEVVTVSGTGRPGGAGSDGVDRTYQVGRTYLVVPLNAEPPFQDSLCTATGLYRPTGAVPDELAAAVGATTVRAASPMGPADGAASGPGLMFGWLVVGALILIAISAAVGMRIRVHTRAGSSTNHDLPTRHRKRWYSLDGAVGRSGLHTVKQLRLKR